MLSIRDYRAKEKMKPVIATTLSEHRTHWNLTQEAMARRLSMSCRSYIDLEHGDSFPSATTLALFLTMLEPAEQEKLLEKLREVFDEIKHSSKNS